MESSLNVMNPRGPEVSGPAFHDPSHRTRPGGDLPTGAPNRHASRALRHGQTEAGVGGRKPYSRSWSLPNRVKKWRARRAMRHGGQPVPPRMTGLVVMRSLSLAACSLSSPPTIREVPKISAGSRNIRVPPQANSPVHIVELRASNVRPHSKTDNRLFESFTDTFRLIHWPHRLCVLVVDGKHLADGLNGSGLTPSGDARRFQGPKRMTCARGQ